MTEKTVQFCLAIKKEIARRNDESEFPWTNKFPARQTQIVEEQKRGNVQYLGFRVAVAKMAGSNPAWVISRCQAPQDLLLGDKLQPCRFLGSHLSPHHTP